jgi:hypothetical protein
MHLGGTQSGNVLRLRDDVPDRTAARIEALVARESPLRSVDSVPRYIDEYLALLGRAADGGHHRSGVTFVVPDGFVWSADATVVASGTAAGERLLEEIDARGMPRGLRELGYTELWAPWCVTIADGTVASVAETVRLGANGVEVGVATVPEFRRRGLALAATAGWATHPSNRSRVRFYSAHSENRASQRVARALGLRFVGATFTIT